MSILKRTLARGAVAVSIALSAALSAAVALPSAAYAETRGTDIVIGKTADERQLQANMLPDITAPRAILVSEDGSSLFERDADAEAKIASTTKIMTAYVALKYGSLDQEVVVSKSAADTIGSTANFNEGDRMTLRDALTGLMLPSGNDAAVAIAETVGATIDPNSDNPYQVFVDKMNEEASALGMEHTLYTNPNGLDVDQWAGDQHSTARDLAKLAIAAMQNADLQTIVSQSDATITVTQSDGTTRDIQLTSTDKLLGQYTGARGVKTGSTDLAGYCFVGSVERNGRMYYTVVLGCSTQDDSFRDTRVLWDWASIHTITYNLTDGMSTQAVTLNGEEVEVPIAAHVAHSEYPDLTVAATISDWDRSLYTYDVAGATKQKVEYATLTGDVHVGDVIGTLQFIQEADENGEGGTVIDTRDIIAIEDVAAPSDLEKVVIAIARIVRQFMGESTVAQSSMEPFDNTADGNGAEEADASSDGTDGQDGEQSQDGGDGSESADGTDGGESGDSGSDGTNREVSTDITIG